MEYFAIIKQRLRSCWLKPFASKAVDYSFSAQDNKIVILNIPPSRKALPWRSEHPGKKDGSWFNLFSIHSETPLSNNQQNASISISYTLGKILTVFYVNAGWDIENVAWSKERELSYVMCAFLTALFIAQISPDTRSSLTTFPYLLMFF